jgi:hypothetical protein
MKRRTSQALPAGLERCRQRFERWRRTREGHPRIPESLWTVAVKAAGRFGLHRTSRALRLDYMVLKRRAGGGMAQGSSREAAPPSFVELLAGGSANATECVLELEDPSGARVRIELKGIAPPDLVALTRSLRVGEA